MWFLARTRKGLKNIHKSNYYHNKYYELKRNQINET